ncbi:MAG: lysophospholipase [Gammaproteobacteria bacterium]
MGAATGPVRTEDGLALFHRAWTAERPRGAIALVHGLAEHSGRYEATGRFLADAGWSVFAVDLRGHGRSPDGARPGRVHVDRFVDYRKDVAALEGLVREHAGALPRFLMGHSMGGLITIDYLLARPAAFAGGIVSSPALAPHPDALPPRPIVWLARLLSLLAPRKLFPSDLDPAYLSHDEAVVRAYVEDPLVSRRVSARWYVEMMKAMRTVHEAAPSLSVPLLLMQSGADRMVAPEAASAWAAAAPDGLVELEVWDGLFHEMLNEPEKDRVRRRMTDWLALRAPQTGAGPAGAGGDMRPGSSP